MNSESSEVVLAAGGLITNTQGEFLLVHRPRYEDWSFPKGKLDEGETLEQCALREVLEETGFVCKLGDPVGSVTYVDRKGRPKEVHYWQMNIIDGSFLLNSEVDEIRWVSGLSAYELLSYVHDRELLVSTLGD
ncbi:MAG: NUDIX hydrolase [Acidimicrobiales bacterium]|nr:NUDIX hydrolase [Acidimicrobiales bacterium]